MGNTLRLESSYGFVGDEIVVCEHVNKSRGRGIWYGNDALNNITSLLVLQIFLIFLVSRTTQFILTPLRQTSIIAQILAGILMGPSFLCQYEAFAETLFPPSGKVAISTFAEFGIMIHFFKTGVQVNPKLIMTIGKKALVIGLAGYLLALVFGSVAYNILHNLSYMHAGLEAELSIIAVLNSLTSFAVISSFLNDLNILNSEIGRLALSTSMVSDGSGWLMAFVLVHVIRAVKFSSYIPVIQVLSVVFYFGFLFFFFRPLVMWIANRTPPGKSMKLGQFLSILCILFVVGVFGQCIGQSVVASSFLFGLLLPDGPPLGTMLEQRLGIICSALLVPVYCTISGHRTSIFSLTESSGASIELVILAGYLGKFTGTILPSLYYDMNSSDALAMALIMCCKGIVELSMLNALFDSKAIGNQVFTLTVFTMVIVTGLATPIVAYIYDPSRRYSSCRRRTILDSEEDLDLRILVCIHNEDNVYPIINLLQASNPTRAAPLCVRVLQLMELKGRAASILKTNLEQKCKSSSSGAICSRHIVNVFNQFEQHNRGCATVQHYTAVAPYASLHDDVCSIALDTNASIVIMPFHQKWAIDGNIGASSPSIRLLNQNVLRKCPCSVGLLVDRSLIREQRSVFTANSSYNIALLFIGGPDDREALAYSLRMSGHGNINLTVFFLRSESHIKGRNEAENNLMEEIKARIRNIKRVTYKDEYVKDGSGTAHVIRMLEGNFDLVIVGRHQEEENPATSGLLEWSECPELGPIGDVLASTDYTFSVLVVQRQDIMYGSWKISNLV